MINTDFNSLIQYRSDGRKNSELRTLQAQTGVDVQSDGSCRLKQGLTEVLCLVNGPYQRPSSSDFLLNIQYTVAPFSSLQKRKSKHDRQFVEFVENIRKSFEGIILPQPYKKSQIQILVTVIQNEGSAKSAVMNCISLALMNAGISMKDMLVSCTVGMIGPRIIVDPSENQEYDLVNEFVISFLPGSQNLDCVELKKAKIKEDMLRQIHKMAVKSCDEMCAVMKKGVIADSLKNMLIF